MSQNRKQAGGSRAKGYFEDQLRYQAALLAECGAHLTAEVRPRQSLIFKKPFNWRYSRQTSYCAAFVVLSGSLHQLLFSLIPPFGEV